VLIRDPAEVAEATNLIGARTLKVVGGRLRAGDGGFNQPWSWHLDPDTVGISDGSVEVCVACPSSVKGDLAYWLRFGWFCPGSEILARLR